MKEKSYSSPNFEGNIINIACTSSMDEKGIHIQREFNFTSGQMTEVLVDTASKKVIKELDTVAIDPFVVDACKVLSGEEISGWKVREDGSAIKRVYSEEMDKRGVYFSKLFNLHNGTISEAIVDKAENGKKEVIRSAPLSHVDHVLLDASRDFIKLNKNNKPKF